MSDAIKTVQRTVGTSSAARALDRLMQREGISASELASRTGMPRQSIYTILRNENDAARINIQALYALATFFGEDMSVFCGLPDYETPMKLTKPEKSFLAKIQKLNATGQEKLLEYVEDLLVNNKYVSS